jgi:putative heme iron utilization protein
MMPYAADDLGRAVFFISSMAMHTQNLQQDSRASLLITQPDVSGDPLGASRLTLLGAVTEVPPGKFVTYIFHGTKTQSTGRTTLTSRTTGWRSPAFTSSEASV